MSKKQLNVRVSSSICGVAFIALGFLSRFAPKPLFRAMGTVMCIGIVWIATSRLSSAQTITPDPSDKRYFSLARVSPVFRPLLIGSGERLLKPGSERFTAGAVIQYGTEAQPVAVQLVLQLPSQVRIDKVGSAVTYDGKNDPRRLPLDAKDLDVVETLVEDSLEGFLRIGAEGGSGRLLGRAIRDVGSDGTTSWVDIFQVFYRSKLRGDALRAKIYYFDSATGLLRRVEYAGKDGIGAQVLLKDWRVVQGSRIPFQIERFERKVLTLRISLSAALLGKGVDDVPFRGN